MANRFLSNIELDAGLVDVNGNTGTSGQILSSTGSGVDWINAPSGTITGSGTTNNMVKWTSSTNIGDSLITDNGSTISLSTNGSSNTFDLSHTSGSGVALNITKGGNNEGLTVNKTSGSGNAVTITGDTQMNGSLGIGSGVTLSESTDRADLLYINSSTSTWGGLQIGNTSNEFIFSLMGDGNVGGIYDDLNSDWIIYWSENAGVKLHFNAVEKFETTAAGINVSGTVTATGGTSTEWNTAYDNSIVSATVTGTTTKTLTLNQQDGGTVTANWADETGSNNYVTSATFNTGDGILTLNRSGLSAVTVDLDGRYVTSSGVTSVATTSPILGGTITSTGTISLLTPVVGDWWNGGAVIVGTDGVTEVGKYIDMHATDAATSDFDVRLTAATGSLAISGNLVVSGGDITLSGTGRIQGVDTVTANTDAANKLYVDNAVAGVPVGDITGVTAGTGLDGGGTSGSVTLNIDYAGADNAILSATDSSGSAISTGAKIWYSDDFTIAYGNVSDLPFTNNTGDITGVTAGTNLTGGGTSGTVTLNMATGGVGAGIYGSAADSTKIDTISVDAYGRVTAVSTGSTGDLSAESSTTNYLSKFTGATTVGNTSFYESGDDLYIPNLIQHIGDTDTYFGFISDGTIQFVANGGSEILIYDTGVRVYGDLRLDGELQILGDGGTSGQVLSSTGTGLDWVWTPQTINSTFSHDAGTGTYVYMPYNTLTDTTSLQYYNTFVAPKTGRVRKIVLKNAGVGTTPSMSSTTLRVVKNGATAYTSSAQSTLAALNQWVSVTLGDSDATFVAGDKLNFGFNANGLWRGATATIIVEYTD